MLESDTCFGCGELPIGLGVVELGIAGGGGVETTVDQTLMHGFSTARPPIRPGPASVSSRASILVGHRITSRVALPCLRLQRCAATSMVFVPDPPLPRALGSRAGFPGFLGRRRDGSKHSARGGGAFKYSHNIGFLGLDRVEEAVRRFARAFERR